MLLYVLVKTGESFQVCDECEAAWVPDVDPTADRFLQLFEIFAERGLSESWDDLSEVAARGD